MPKTWNEAQETCNEEKGNLATIFNQETRDVVRGLLRYGWIGLTRQWQEGKWQTATKLATRLTRKGYEFIKNTIWKRSSRDFGARAYLRQVVSKVIPLNISQRLRFCRDHRNWSEDDWENVLFF